MKNFLLGVLVTTVALATCMFGYLRLGLPEVRADLSPPRWESYLMYTSVHASVRRRAPELPNPIKPTDENLIAGGKFYLDACAGCHGTPGKPFGGKGPVMYPPIPELPVVGTEYSEAQIFWIAKHGLRRSGMFANGVWASDEKLWTAAAYIKHLKSLPPAVQAAVAKRGSAALNEVLEANSRLIKGGNVPREQLALKTPPAFPVSDTKSWSMVPSELSATLSLSGLGKVCP